MRRRLLLTAAVAALGAAGVALLGYDVAHVALVAAALTAIGLVTGEPGVDHRFAPLPAPSRQGVRPEVTELSWLLEQGRVAPGFHRRLRAVARERLALHGVALDDVPAVAALPVAEVARLGRDVLGAVGDVVVGMARPLRLALATILAGGHVLFEDVPGLGKTLAARSLATALGLELSRLQCTPDLLPADITGSYVYDPARSRFEFRPGPVFTGLLLADEINRTAPKSQSALLEAMAERQVTVEGTSFALPAPFHVLATANPVEYEGTYPLPEAQLDRFMVRLAVGYLGRGEEVDVLRRRIARRQESAEVERVVAATDLLAMQAGVEAVDVEPDVLRYCVDLAAATREHEAVEVGASPRGSQALALVGRALAVLDGRAYVLPEDVKEVAVPALAHRITLTTTAWASGVQPERVVESVLGEVPTPATVRASRP